ncbi:MAG: DUF4153 domain-containing protein, partial [Erysipelotrichaceae bacterium]|nr:DUF4153 domain-containing protein [Erysipelotrichaceae bacterium]
IAEITVNGLLILSYIPKKDSELPVPKAYSIIVNKVGLWIYFGLIAILYLYLGKIIITFQMPNGRINWFASLAMLFYCFFYLSCQGRRNALETFFANYGGFIMIPILAMQAFAVYIRVSAYGLTTLRYLSILLDVVGISFVLTSFTKAPVRLAILVMALAVLIAFIGPLNILDVPFRNQRSIFNSTLERNGMLVDGKIVASDKVSEEDREIIRSTYDYLRYSDSELDNPVKEISTSDFRKVFGFDLYEDQPDPTDRYVYATFYSAIDEIDVSGYSRFRTASYYYGTGEAPKYMADYLMNLYEQYGEYLQSETPLTLETEDGATLYITVARLTLSDGEIHYLSIEGYLLYK